MFRNNRLNSSTRRRDGRRWIQGGMLFLLALDILFFVLAFRPAGHSFVDQKAEVERLREELKLRRAAVERLTRVEANLAEARRKGDQFYGQKFLTKDTGYSQIMEELDKLATANGVRKGSVTYTMEEVKNRPDLQSVKMSTTLEGDYSKIVQFINRLEQSPLFLTVDSLVVGSGQTRTVKLGVNLVTYFRVQPLSVGL